jgi:hypothetical protein
MAALIDHMKNDSTGDAAEPGAAPNASVEVRELCFVHRRRERLD